MARSSSTAPTSWTERRIEVLALTLLGLFAALAFVPGIFTIDEDNLIAWVVSLRSGHLSLPGTQGLPASRELLFFDPIAPHRAAGPAVSSVPPLVGLFALPFSWLGFLGLFLPNLLAWLCTTALVVAEARRQQCTRLSAWAGGLAFCLGGFSLEYAAGVWPHALSAFLCFAGFVLALRAVEAGRPALVALAGLCAGLAAGVRYQNAVFAALVALTVCLAARRRLRLCFAYLLGIALPTLACAAINHARMGSWHPFSKGLGYTRLPVPTLGAHAGGSPFDPWRSFVGRVVDFSLYPHDRLWTDMGGRYGSSGALLLLSAVKKALLQSAPWMLLAFLLMAAAWRRRTEPVDERRRASRAALVVCGGVVLLFALAGSKRHEGWSYNARYLLDLVPLAALVVAFRLSSLAPTWRSLALGAVIGATLAGTVLLFSPASFLRQWTLLRLPLLLALPPVVLFFAGRRWPLFRRFEAPALAVCFGWAVTAHLGDDLPAARAMRTVNQKRWAAVDSILPNTPSAVLAHAPASLGPLLFDHDVVVADTAVDVAHDAPVLIDALRRAGRRVFAILVNMPEPERKRVTAGRVLRPIGDKASGFVEIVGP
jgi:hypothetical protein